MSNQQLYLAIGVPILFNGLAITILIAYMNARFSGMENSLEKRFDATDRRFDDMRDLWPAELHRVEEVFDARLKHLQQH